MSNMNASTSANLNPDAKDKEKDGKNADHKPVLDFTSLPPEELEAYISYYNLAKPYPPPLSNKPPSRSNRASHSKSDSDSQSHSHSQSQSEVNRVRPLPRRRGRTPESRIEGIDPTSNTVISRKRTAAAVEMEERALQEQKESQASTKESTKLNGLEVDKNGEFICPEHFSDLDHANNYLGNVASRHFQNQPAPKEGEAVVGFLYRCATKDKVLKIA